jgi:hypothetical protein
MVYQMKNHIARELIEMARRDLSVRERLLSEGKLFHGYNPEMEQVHIDNASRLKEIIMEIGWPTISKVGEQASDAAWLIVQHAISDPTFVKRCYGLMNESKNDINPQNVAYLHDRICYFEGRPQKYGSQFDDRGLYPVESKAEVNQLRARLGLHLHPEEKIVEALSLHCGDLHQDEEFNAWRRKVGWID